MAFQICSLTDGEDFRAGPNWTPDQHIYRAVNPVWILQRPDRPRQPPATMSKFRVRRHLHNDRDYWSPYDLPVLQWYGSGTRFGNCAETYPFVDLLMYVLCFLCCVHC